MPKVKKTDEMTERTKRIQESPFNFFTEGDFNSKGHICSDVPSWACYQFIDDLEKEIKVKESQLEEGGMTAQARAKLAKELNERRERLEQVSKKPKINKDKIFKVVGKDREGGSLGDKIAESMFSYDDMKRGVVPIDIEVKRMLDPCIKLSPEEAEMAAGCNIRMDKNCEVSRDDAVRVWRTGRQYLEELSNIEVLRRT
jgi:hypothetical protein